MGTPYCPDDLLPHEQVNCDNFFPGGITECVVFNSNATTTDPTNATTIQSDLDAGRAVLIKTVFGEMPEGTPKEITNPINNTPILQGIEFAINFQDWNYTVDNVTFYDNLNYTRASAILFYEPLLDGIGRCKWVANVNNGVGFKALPVVPLGDSEVQYYQVTVNWVDRNGPEIVDLPTGIFNQ